MSLTVTKRVTPEELSRHVEFFESLPDGNKPRILAIGETSYEYEYVDGRHPSTMGDVWRIHAATRDLVWDARGPMRLVTSDDVTRYADYVYGRAPSWCAETLRQAVAEILPSDLTPARRTHGDLTLENVLIDDCDRVVFLDPGRDHGLKCREIDQAKILQSLCGWERARRGSTTRINDRPFVRRTHWTLYATHLARLLAHGDRHPKAALDWARRQLQRWARTVDPDAPTFAEEEDRPLETSSGERRVQA